VLVPFRALRMTLSAVHLSLAAATTSYDVNLLFGVLSASLVSAYWFADPSSGFFAS